MPARPILILPYSGYWSKKVVASMRSLWGESNVAWRAGFTPDRILFTGVNVSTPELKSIAGKRVPINVDSLSELERLARDRYIVAHIVPRKP